MNSDYMCDGLDGTANKAAEAAKYRRKRHIGWPEQLEFFKHHLREYGLTEEEEEMFMARAEMGFEKYGDRCFWYDGKELNVMGMEEFVDCTLYTMVYDYGDELSGE